MILGYFDFQENERLINLQLINQKYQSMLKHLFILFFFLGAFSLSAQETDNQKRIKAIPTEINKAVASEDFQKAADLKREQELREELETALKSEDYQKAANLKKQIETGEGGNSGTDNSAKIAELEKEMQTAVDNEDYKRAGDLKKEIESIKSGKPVDNTSSNRSSGSSSNYSGNTPTIDFVNQVFLLNNDNSTTKLEKVQGKLTTSAGGFGGYGSATSSYVLEGSRSPVRLSPNQMKFVVKVYQGIDPSESFVLSKVEVRGRRKNRYADQYKSTSAWGHSETGKVSENQVEIQFKKLSDEVFEITIPGGIEPGEYAFQYIDKLFAFGVD